MGRGSSRDIIQREVRVFLSPPKQLVLAIQYGPKQCNRPARDQCYQTTLDITHCTSLGTKHDVNNESRVQLSHWQYLSVIYASEGAETIKP